MYRDKLSFCYENPDDDDDDDVRRLIICVWMCVIHLPPREHFHANYRKRTRENDGTEQFFFAFLLLLSFSFSLLLLSASLPLLFSPLFKEKA